MNNIQIKTLEEYHEKYAQSISNPEAFWEEIANEFQWTQKWDKVLEWNFKEPDIKWFKGAKLNITENMLDRHLEKRGNKLALIWEPNDPKQRFVRYTYRELYEHVCQFANALKEKGIKKGDRVCIYMPMIPELAVAVLACARIGAIHSVVFAGFSSSALADRINDAVARIGIDLQALLIVGEHLGALHVEIEHPAIDQAHLAKVHAISPTSSGTVRRAAAAMSTW